MSVDILITKYVRAWVGENHALFIFFPLPCNLSHTSNIFEVITVMVLKLNEILKALKHFWTIPKQKKRVVVIPEPAGRGGDA